MADFKNIPDQVKQFWASRTGNQKGFLLGGSAATVFLLIFFVRLLSTPDYKPLYKDLEPADAQTLAAALDAQNIPHQASADGKTISVPADKMEAALLQATSQGRPHSGRIGFELFDKMSWGQTEFDEKVSYQRALEGELERTIQTLSEIESARVHLVMPKDSVFLDRQREAKASVILKLHRGSLSKDAVLAISRLVSGAVEGLKPEEVSIIDADSDRSLGLGRDSAGSAEGEEARLTQQLISTLEPVVGANAIRASVNINYDQGSSEESQEKYDPTVRAVLSEQKTEDRAGGSVPSTGVPGTASNTPSPNKAKPANAVQNGMQSSTSENTQYGVNKTVVHTVTPAGRIQRVTAALLVDDVTVKSVKGDKVTFTKRKRSQEELGMIRELAQAAIGFDAKRGDIISVQNMSFDANSAEPDLPAPTWNTRVQKTVSDYSSVLRPVSLLILFMLAYLFVLRPVQKHALTPVALAAGRQTPLMVGGDVQSLTAGSTETSDDTARAVQLKEQTIELIKLKPMDSARAVRAWMREETS